MSAYIFGSEIAADLGLLDFEFAQEFVANLRVSHENWLWENMRY
jgi:hypothetical protein